MRDMLVLDWLFGHHKKDSLLDNKQSDGQSYADHSYNDDYGCDYFAQQDLDNLDDIFDDF